MLSILKGFMWFINPYDLSTHIIQGCFTSKKATIRLCRCQWGNPGEKINQNHNTDSKVHGANMGPSWGWQDPGGPHVGPMNFAIWEHNKRQESLKCQHISRDICSVWSLDKWLMTMCQKAFSNTLQTPRLLPVSQNLIIPWNAALIHPRHNKHTEGEVRMMSGHGNVSCITGPLWGESTDAELRCFVCC